jgi:Ni/Fe-hydrogenase subunit HybB-like protein
VSSGIGFAFYFKQLQFGLGITGMSRDVSWGFYIANFTYLVGVAAGGVMVVLPYYLHDYKAYGRITVMGEFLAIASIVMCLLFILADLGQPMRALNVLLYPTPHSVLFYDMLSCSTAICSSTCRGGLERIGSRTQRHPLPEMAQTPYPIYPFPGP